MSDSEFPPPDENPAQSEERPSSLDSVLREVEDVAGPATAFLVGLSGKHAGKLFRIPPGISIIGRTSRALVQIEEKAVSHQHAEIELTRLGCFVRDLESTNGSIVNDLPLTRPRELHAGDVLKFGHAVFGFLTDAEDDEQHTRAMARVTGGRHTFAPPAAGAIAPYAPLDGGTSRSPSPMIVASHSVPAPATPEEVSGLDSALDKFWLLAGLFGVYWKLLALSALAFAIVGAVTVAFLPPKAVASFEILLRQEQTKNPTQHFATRGIDYFAAAEKGFKNLEVVKQTMKDMGLDTNGNAVRGTAAGLSMEPVSPNTYKGKFGHTDPDFAERFLAQHVQNFLEKEIGKSIKVLNSEVELLHDQYSANEKHLKTLEGELRDFRLQHLGSLPEVASNQMQSMASLLARRDELMAALDRYTNELALSRRQLASEDALFETKVLKSEPYEDSLADVRKTIADALANGLSEGHPDLIRYRGKERELIKLRDQAVSASITDTDRRANPEHKRLQNRTGELEVAVASTHKELSLVQGRLGEINRIAEDVPKVEADHGDLMRRVASGQLLHGRLYEQLKAKELELEFERASVEARYEIVEPPLAMPVSSVRSSAVRAALGGFLGFFLGMGIAGAHWLFSYESARRNAAQVVLADQKRDLIVVDAESSKTA